MTSCSPKADEPAGDDGPVVVDALPPGVGSIGPEAWADTMRRLEETRAAVTRILAPMVEARLEEYPDNPTMRWLLEVAPTCVRMVSTAQDSSDVNAVAGLMSRYAGGSIIGIEPEGFVSLPDSSSLGTVHRSWATNRFLPAGPDSVAVSFGHGRTSPWAVLVRRSDALEGRFGVTWDVGPTTSRLGPVRLEPTPCPRSASDPGLRDG
jgi:hypothetical protein